VPAPVLPVYVPPQAPAYVYCSVDDVAALLSEEGVLGRAGDDASPDGGALSAQDVTNLGYAVWWATGRVNQFLQPAYPPQALAGDPVVNFWTASVAARVLCLRRGNGVPASIEKLYEEALASLKEVKAGRESLAGSAMRGNAWPAGSNVRVEWGYLTRRIRVETQISDPAAPGAGSVYNQAVDLPSAYVPER
jgi:hypothetical protein